MRTLLLDANWDLSVDKLGNLPLATDGYAVAQDVASACRAFQSELWYNSLFGMPYFDQILGRRPSLQFLKAQFIAVGSTVPGVSRIVCFLTGPGKPRQLGGQLQITDVDGNLSVVGTENVLGTTPWYVSAVEP